MEFLLDDQINEEVLESNDRHSCHNCNKEFPLFELEIHFLICQSIEQSNSQNFKTTTTPDTLNLEIGKVESKNSIIEDEKFHFEENICDESSEKTKTSSKSSNSSKHYNVIENKDSKIFECKYCNKTFHRQGTFSSHCSRRHRDKILSKVYLKNYDIIESEKSKTFQCKVCKKNFETRQRFHTHYHIMHKEKVLQCNKCKKRYVDQTKLNIHQKICGKIMTKPSKNKNRNYSIIEKGDSQMVQCKECNKIFQKVDRFYSHYKHLHREKKYHCENCKKSFPVKKHLRRHLRSCNPVHLDEIMNLYCNIISKDEGEMFQCKKCDKLFIQRRNLYFHINKIHYYKSFKCDICKKSFECQSTLDDHYRKCNGTSEKREDLFESEIQKNPENEARNIIEDILNGVINALNITVRGFKCWLCKSVLKTKGSFNIHMETHARGKLKCDKCHDTFPRKNVLQRHIISCNGKINSLKCPHCDKVYHTMYGMKDHVKNIHNLDFDMKAHSIQQFKCDKCHDNLADNRSLRRHVKTCDGRIRSKKCTHCIKVFLSDSALETHVKNRHLKKEAPSKQLSHCSEDSRKVSCEICDQSCYGKAGLIDHALKEHDIKIYPYKCQNCPSSFSSRKLHSQHLEEKHNEDSHSCNICGKKFSKPDYIQNHISIVHHKKTDHVCEFCNKGFSTVQTLKFHISLIHKEKDIKCHLCDKTFRLGFQLKEHIEGFHEQKFKCVPCDKVWIKRQQYTDHIKIIHEGKVVARNRKEMCEACGKIMHPSLLPSHIEMWHEIVEEQCETCGKIFSKKIELKTHLFDEHGIRMQPSLGEGHKCKICSKVFKNYQTYYNHKRIMHDNVRFKCKFCEKEFTQNQNLDRHVESTHENIEKQCDSCGKMISRKALKGHLLDEHGIRIQSRAATSGKIWECKPCNKVFKNYIASYNHKKKIHDNFRYKCKFCEKEFTQSQNLNRHVVSHVVSIRNKHEL